ncbi:MAG TPA: Wzy polymerase domain-containing protein [Ramlibacter sp.]|nr:Wzy polymerase domain-containing protein [Ramlibacter sp.]
MSTAVLQDASLARRTGFATVLIGLCLALPWLQPFAPGPSSNVVPWLASAACVLLAFGLTAPAWPRRSRLLLVVAVVAFVALRPAHGVLDRVAFAGTALLLVLAWGIARGRARDGGSLVPAIAWAWVGAALLSSVIALLQYFDWAAGLSPWVHVSRAGEALANLRQRNQFSSFTTIGLAAVLWLASRPGARWPRWIPAVVLLACANAASISRTGMLQWLVLLALVAIWQAPNRRRNVALCGIALAAYGVAGLLLPLALERVTGIAPESLLGRLSEELGCISRKVLWRNVLQMIAAHPWAGWGWGELDFAHYMQLYGDGPRFCEILDNAHNLPLHLAVELGLPFALLATAAALWLLLRARPWIAPDPQRQLAWGVLMALASHSLLEYPLWYGPFQSALGLAAGLLASALAGAPQQPMMPGLRRGIVAAGLALVAYAGWDYARVSQIYAEPNQRLSWWRDDALGHAQASWLFASQARFAALTLEPLTRDNLGWSDAMAQELLHYSPEPRVVERVIEAATMQGRTDEAVLHLARFRAAFPKDYESWRRKQRGLPGAATLQP